MKRQIRQLTSQLKGPENLELLSSPTNLLDFAIQITKSPETSRLSNSKEWWLYHVSQY